MKVRKRFAIAAAAAVSCVSLWGPSPAGAGLYNCDSWYYTTNGNSSCASYSSSPIKPTSQRVRITYTSGGGSYYAYGPWTGTAQISQKFKPSGATAVTAAVTQRY